jgi:uncharacterized membrane protein YozB (DUF420 family)
MKGFLGTGAPLAADLNLVAQLAMGAALIAGTFLARQRRYTAHGVCQTVVLLLNLVPIAAVMWPSFHKQVLPRLSSHLRHRYYAVAAAHAALGAAAEVLGLYVALVAGTSLVPRRLRFRNWKVWMRAVLVVWWVALVAGLATYYWWYVEPFSR